MLSDPQRRERYDNFGMSAVKDDGAGAGPGMGMCFNNQAIIIGGGGTTLIRAPAMLVSFLVPIMHMKSGSDSLPCYHKPLKTKCGKITWDFRSKSRDILKFSSKEK